MENQELNHFLEYVGKDPSRLIFEDEATGIYNRRYLHHYLQYKIPDASQEDQSLSLIMLDVDHFKEINDTYGHQIGDEALIWVAEVLKKIAGKDCIPIRYAGDEFMILLPDQKKDFALKMGERILEWARSEPFRHKTMDNSLNITFSIGIASVPMNRKSCKELIHKADTALYYAKQKGRDCLADSDSLDNEVVFSKTAINKLEDIKIVGRKKQLEQVAESLKKFAKPENQFLIIEGAAGMGKSVFLDVVHRTLEQSKIYTIKTKGIPQEMFRPYYSIIDILMSILNQREDKGAGIFRTLTQEEIAYLSNFLPLPGEKKGSSIKKNKKLQREDIFNTLIRLFFKIINKRPFAILVDDLHYLDEATLLLFRQMKLECKSPLFICGSSPETADLQDYNEMASLELFYKTYSRELDIKKIALTPLTAVDISNHIKGIFSNVHLSENIIKELMQITQGNPLFLSEILRKLVQDQKIVLVGHEWLVLPCDEGYLPKSLDEIVSQKIEALDEENRQLLDQMSAFGTNIPVSALTGSSGKIETQVLEFIDKAKNQGLINSEFNLNDETINFLSRSILQIAYGSIGDKRKQEMHEKIGNYQEALYKKNLLPSVATLAYHFKRSSDQTRTQKYEKLISDWNSKIFNAKEAEKYELPEETTNESFDEGGFLDSVCLEKVPNIIRYLLNGLRISKLYPKGSQSTINAIKQLKQEIDQVLKNTNFVNIVYTEQTLLVNDQEIDIAEFEAVANNFFTFLEQFDLKSIGFYKGVTENELEVLLDGFCDIKTDILDPDFWQRFFTEHPDITNITLKQVRYTKKADRDEPEMELKSLDQNDSVTLEKPFFQLFTTDMDLVQEDLAHVLEIIRALLRTSRNIKLYPLESKAISDSIEDLMRALQSIFTKYPVLSLSRVSNSLLVNGRKIDVTVFGTMGQSFLKFLETSGINSLSFLQCITLQELQLFIGSLGQLPDAPSNNNFWEQLCEEKEFSGILLNKQLYEILEGIKGDDDDSNENAEDDISKEEEAGETTEDTLDSFLQAIKERLSDLFIKENKKKLQKTIKELFKGFHDRDSSGRRKVIDCCQSTLADLNLAGKCRLSELMAGQLLDIFSEEKDHDILKEMASIFNQMINCFIQFAEYQMASKILFHLHKNQELFNETNNEHAQIQSKGMNINLDPSTQRLLINDLRSSDSSRQKDTAQLLEMLGEAAIPMLIDVIKKEDDFRIRKISSTLLEEMSPDVGKQLKQELLKEIDIEERIRILEILDNFNTDLKDDLAVILNDRNPRVRKAGFQLAERLDEKYVIEVLLDFAENEETSLATAAIKSLGKFKIPKVGQRIHSLLNSIKEEERLIALCRALGQIGDPSSIEPLAKILAPKHFFSFYKKSSIQVRTAAAYALSQISHTKGAEVLRLYVEDPNPGIRHIAKSALEKVKSSGN